MDVFDQKQPGSEAWRKMIRPIIAFGAGGAALYYTMDARVEMYEAHLNTCDYLMRSSENCSFDGSDWQLITIMANLGAVSVGVIGWWLAPYTGLTEKP